MKKVIAIMLAVVMLICACPFSAFAVVRSDSSSKGWTVFLHDEMKWDHMYVYAFDGRGYPIDAQWPGTEIKADYDEGYSIRYSVDIPGNAKGIIFNDGNGKKTSAVNNFQGADYDDYYYWINGDKDDAGDFSVTLLVSGWASYDDWFNSYYPYTIRLTDTYNWGTAYVYAWDKDSCDANGAWPGEQTAETVVNGAGETEFICHIPYNAAGIVINNGNGSQTSDITDFLKYEKYRFVGYDSFWDMYNVEGIVEREEENTEPEEEITRGDASGDGAVNVSDATVVQQYSAEMIELEGGALAAADTNRDGIVSVSDATLIQQYAAEMIEEF